MNFFGPHIISPEWNESFKKLDKTIQNIILPTEHKWSREGLDIDFRRSRFTALPFKEYITRYTGFGLVVMNDNDVLIPGSIDTGEPAQRNNEETQVYKIGGTWARGSGTILLFAIKNR